MTDIPTAYMILTSRDKVQKFAHCPDHGNRSSRFVAEEAPFFKEVEVRYWYFRCPEKGGHVFKALADPDAPRTQEEYAQWFKQRQMARIQDSGTGS